MGGLEDFDRLPRTVNFHLTIAPVQQLQEGVSRLEKRVDPHLSTLREMVRAMGGKLRLVVEFPDRPPVLLSGFEELEHPPSPNAD